MTGPEHFRAAEEWIEYGLNSDHADPELRTRALAAANAHATLALAAAQALGPVAHFMGDDPLITQWGHLLGHTKVAAGASA